MEARREANPRLWVWPRGMNRRTSPVSIFLNGSPPLRRTMVITTRVCSMSDVPDNLALSERLAILEERMKTMQADYRTDIARLAEDMAKRDAARSERDAARSERDATARWWQTTIIIGAVAIALGVAGLIFS